MKIRDGRIAKARIVGDKIEAIAASEKVSSRHVLRVLAKPEVRAAVGDAARAMTRTAALVVQRGAANAATALVSMADGTATASAPRIAAARGVLELALRAVEIDDVLTRLLEIEAVIREREEQHPRGWPT